MTKRIAVRMALVLVVLLVLAAALPFSASANLYIWGHVWEMSSFPDPWGNEPWGQGVPGVQVLLQRDGIVIRQPTTTNANGDYGFEISGRPGIYTIVVNVPMALTTPDGRSAFLFDGAVRLGDWDAARGWTWTRIPGLTNAVYPFVLGENEVPGRWLTKPVDFLYTCSGAAPMAPIAREDGMPCYNPAWNRIYVHGVVKNAITMAYVGGVQLQLFEQIIDPVTGLLVWVPATRLVTGEIPTTIICSSATEAATHSGGKIGFWGMGFTYRPRWYAIACTGVGLGGLVPVDPDGDGFSTVFAYCEGGTNAQKEASNWPLMTADNLNGEIIIWVR